MQEKSHINQKLHEKEYTKRKTALASYPDAVVSVPLFP